MTGPYTHQVWRYVPGDSVSYKKCVREVGEKGCGVEYLEKAFAPVDWPSFEQRLIALNVVALAAGTRSYYASHGTTKRLALWSGGKELVLRYRERDFPEFEYLFRSE